MRHIRKYYGESSLYHTAIIQAFCKLHPASLIHNPVMFVVGVGSVLCTYAFFQDMYQQNSASFSGQISLWLWFTLLFANFAEALAEGRGKAQANSLRSARSDTLAVLRHADGSLHEVSAAQLCVGDTVLVAAGQMIPADGTVVEGAAAVDESAITGESAPLIRECGGDRSAVTGGTTVLSDHIVVRVSQEAGKSFLDRMIALVEGAERQKTPNEIALNVLLAGLTLIFLLAVVTLKPLAMYHNIRIDIVVLVALLVCLIPTTISGLLASIGIAGMNRLLRCNVLAMSGRAVEAAGDVDVLLLDKTGTITLGNRMAAAFIPLPGVPEDELLLAALHASAGDETPEGRSIVDLATLLGLSIQENPLPLGAELVPFSADTRMSGVDLPVLSEEHAGPEKIRKGATDAVLHWMTCLGQASADSLAKLREDVCALAEPVASSGGTPLVVASSTRGVLGLIHLKDVVKPGMRERFDRIRAMGIRTIMVTGDNRLTAAAIAREAGVDDFLAEAKPEDKLSLIMDLQKEGRLVAMSGDGTNDAPALAKSDVGLVMNTGTQAAREAGNMIDLDSDPTKLIEIVEIGKQLLITRGAMTTFSLANDVAKYFAIIPALFMAALPELGMLNVMSLSTPQSAILSAVIFNALIIMVLIPLALKGVRYRPRSTATVLRGNLVVYGLGGLAAPFVGIKLIDMLLTSLKLV
ncbi:MAG: potassium-transporting ATPase subunit KdpB [Desulfovibrionaceae bacterium]